MSLWNDLVDGFKARLLDIYPAEWLDKDSVRWILIEPKFDEAFALLQSLKGRRECRDASAVLNELNGVLGQKRLLFDDDFAQFHRIRVALLDLWYLLLKNVILWTNSTVAREKAAARAQRRDLLKEAGNGTGVTPGGEGARDGPGGPRVGAAGAAAGGRSGASEGAGSDQAIKCHLNLNDTVTFYTAIGHIMCRREFDPTMLRLDRANQMHCSNETRQIGYRYRLLLFKTQSYAQRAIMLQSKSSASPSHSAFSFYARVFAINCFRVPTVSRLISNSVTLDATQYASVEPHLTQEALDGPVEDPIDAISDAYMSHSPSNSSPVSTTAEVTESNARSHVISVPGRRGPARDTSSDAEVASNTSSASPEQMVEGSKHAGTDRHGDAEEETRGRFDATRVQYGSSPRPLPRPYPGASNGEDMTMSTREVRRMLKEIPQLFQWHQFHFAMMMWKSDDEDEKLSRGGDDWLEELKRLDVLFFMFLDEWAKHVIKMTDGSFDLNWWLIPGFRHFLPAFLYSVKRQVNFGRALMSCSCAMLVAMPTLINFFIMLTFSRTNVYDIFGVMNTVNQLETWLEVFESRKWALPRQFDCNFFCRAIDIMIGCDHHQVVQKALRMLYSYSDVFVSEARRALFIDLVLHKHFYSLFLHWDPAIRNSFQQLLVFKMIRAKRSELTGDGGVVSKGRIYFPPGTTAAYRGGIEEGEVIMDTIIYGKIESYVRIVRDQVNEGGMDRYPSSLEVYVPRALDEYRTYQRMYAKWESEGGKEVPGLVPLSNA